MIGRRSALGLAVAVFPAVLGACSLLHPLDGLSCEPGAGNASCRYGEGCKTDADCATTACRGEACQCPDDMVTIDSGYCVDRTEVSNDAYQAFVDSAPAIGAQDGFCSWNTDFAIDVGGPLVCAGRAAEGGYPATCVDWCDAKAFCASLGRHLCGRIHGAANPESGYRDPSQSEWFNACSRGGAQEFATTDAPLATCNGDSDGPEPVGGRNGEVCEGGYDGLQRMSGNVREWEDSCSGETGPGDACLTRGGAFDSGDEAGLRCDALDERSRDDTDHAIGFRCCSG